MRADRYASFFVVNLCVVDLVAAAVVMPWSLAGGVSSQTSSTNVTLQSGVPAARRRSAVAGRRHSVSPIG